ncbi:MULTISPECIES: hypothetical protein [Peribacillus]|uniref:hypothetical protein n=1 Tax=Peribacillus TaxID=2675229 RepID=UPI0030F4FA67
MAKEKAKNIVTNGDVFAVNLPNGKYGAIRIADSSRNFHIVSSHLCNYSVY